MGLQDRHERGTGVGLGVGARAGATSGSAPVLATRASITRAIVSWTTTTNDVLPRGFGSPAQVGRMPMGGYL
jgi:hypothetical protein